MKDWWESDAYEIETPLPDVLARQADSNFGPALVRAWKDGTTDPGWGEKTFVNNYVKMRFSPRAILAAYDKELCEFALVMRGFNAICIDIDGKNGGLDHVRSLGMLPPTLAETSKSGDGYHLFYSTDDVWSPELGFAKYRDRIGIKQGVDIRATGCVYHYRTQRWNGRLLAPLPEHLSKTLLHREQVLQSTTDRITKIVSGDDQMEILMLHTELLEELKKPIPQGKRNNTLFAIGAKMAQANVDDWESVVEDRATQVGLDALETDKLLRNIKAYGAQQP